MGSRPFIMQSFLLLAASLALCSMTYGYQPMVTPIATSNTSTHHSFTKDSECPGSYCKDGHKKTPPYSCHSSAPAPPTPAPPAPASPNCTQAGQDGLCKIACESSCRGFLPGFKVAGCADQKVCTDPPAWAKGSVCECSSAPPAPPTPPAPAIPTCAQAGKAVLCQVACESTCRSFPPGFKAAGCADQKYCTNPPAWAKGSVCTCPSELEVSELEAAAPRTANALAATAWMALTRRHLTLATRQHQHHPLRHQLLLTALKLGKMVCARLHASPPAVVSYQDSR